MEWMCLSSGEIDFKWQKAVQSVCGGQVLSLARRLMLNPSLNLPLSPAATAGQFVSSSLMWLTVT